MRAPEKINAASLGAVGLLFFVLALTPIGEFWQPVREIRDIYLWIGMFTTALVVTVVRAERQRIDSLDLWMFGVWVRRGRSQRAVAGAPAGSAARSDDPPGDEGRLPELRGARSLGDAQTMSGAGDRSTRTPLASI